MNKSLKVNGPDTKTVAMSITEFLNWEAIAYKTKWTYIIKGAMAYVTAPVWVLQNFGYDLE